MAELIQEFPSQAWWILPLTVALAALLTLALTPVARKIGLVDHPGERKVHEAVTPLTGGPAIFIAFALAVYLTIPGDRYIQALVAGSLLMFITGGVDDRRHVSPALRFLLQIGACLIMILWADIRLLDFGRLMWDGIFGLGWLAAPVTIFAAMGVINSFNMIDGMDGLAGGIFLVAAAGMALFAGLAGDVQLQLLLLLSMAAVAGFMLLNARFPWNEKARAFLGDAGSMFLGFVLAWFFITLGSGEARATMPMTAVWLFAVPLLDTTTLMWRRWRSGESAFVADQHHLHHAFLRAGYSVGETWTAIVLLAAVLAGVGVLFELGDIAEYLGFWLFIGFAFVYYFYMKHSWEAQRFLGREFICHDSLSLDTHDAGFGS
jgi:UDP-GlcNAc:undecaprenyl-phosphate GlcNAc-1-phosphate transferase